MENGGGKHAQIDMFVAHCACRAQCSNKIKNLDGSLENMLNVEGGNMPTLTCLWLTVRVGYNVETKSRTYMGP